MELAHGLDFIVELLAMEPKREAPVRPPATRHIVVASDAQADTAPSGGYLLFDPSTGAKRGGYFSLCL